MAKRHYHLINENNIDYKRIISLIDDTCCISGNTSTIYENNVINHTRVQINISNFWKALVIGITTTQQRSGNNTNLADLLDSGIITDYNVFVKSKYSYDSLLTVLHDNKLGRGIKRKSKALIDGFNKIDKIWIIIEQYLSEISKYDISDIRKRHIERNAAQILQFYFYQIGPKQSRNVLQAMGLSQYVIPLDSRFINWLVSSYMLENRKYNMSNIILYNIIEEDLWNICDYIERYPCLLDQAVFNANTKKVKKDD